MNYPKIGIRPTIDGREGGVRESLEEQVMNMAKSAAAFLSENLKYPNGEAVECVIADSCIGGVAEAAATASEFEKEGVGPSLCMFWRPGDLLERCFWSPDFGFHRIAARFADSGDAAAMAFPDYVLTGEIRKFRENRSVSPAVSAPPGRGAAGSGARRPRHR